MTVYEYPANTLAGEPIDLHRFADSALLIVNVASKCGFTPQYAGLEQLHAKYQDRGFSVLGVPCNQFGGQEPGTPEEIAEFCSATYGVTFPMLAKVDVNGETRHPLYAELTQYPDSDGIAGDVQWNFEKFLISPEGAPVGRFRSAVAPDDPALVGAIEAQLPR
ncbi:MAG: glutathione peroxidase [Actinobacteria bacterium 69-20]|nr:glutathione peroxidase [Actinomycetota bacterium]OJV30979.1 MAG: glutathione peroxidase [Actinobacteria bacterium 69-20]